MYFRHPQTRQTSCAWRGTYERKGPRPPDGFKYAEMAKTVLEYIRTVYAVPVPEDEAQYVISPGVNGCLGIIWARERAQAQVIVVAILETQTSCWKAPRHTTVLTHLASR